MRNAKIMNTVIRKCLVLLDLNLIEIFKTNGIIKAKLKKLKFLNFELKKRQIFACH